MVALACVYPDHVSFPGVFAGLADDLAGLVVKFDSELGCPLEALEIEASVSAERGGFALVSSGEDMTTFKKHGRNSLTPIARILWANSLKSSG
jgi:hypothetical protein